MDEKLKLTLGIKCDERLIPSMDRKISGVEDPQCSSYPLNEAAHSTIVSVMLQSGWSSPVSDTGEMMGSCSSDQPSPQRKMTPPPSLISTFRINSFS